MMPHTEPHNCAMAADTHRPLAGIQVLDLTNVLAGPFCCHQLALLGAEVIKVEMPQSGDLARQLGADPARNAALMGVSFLAQNTGKQSITVNLKSPDGRAVLHKLVARADVLVENFRPGVMARLGLGYRALTAHNAQLIYCAISGFGQDGPLQDAPAYDQIVQGMSGVMSITGDTDSAPLRVGYPLGDTVGGLTAAFAISASLAKPPAERGAFIDVSMLESVLATLGWAVSNYLVAGQAPQPMGNDNVTASPSGAFRTADGLINIAANKQEQFEALCRVIGSDALAADPRFAVRQARLEHRDALAGEIEAVLQTRETAHWVDALNAKGVPAGPVLSIPEVLAHPQVAGRGLIGEYTDAATNGTLHLARTGLTVDGVAPATDTPPPALGADTEAILQRLGYSSDEIAELVESGAV